MISFELKDDSEKEVTRVLSSTHLFSLAESLGGVESLINHPASMTHSTYTPEERAQHGISEGLVRLSVGLEDVADLLADIHQALAKCSRTAPRRALSDEHAMK